MKIIKAIECHGDPLDPPGMDYHNLHIQVEHEGLVYVFGGTPIEWTKEEILKYASKKILSGKHAPKGAKGLVERPDLIGQ